MNFQELQDFINEDRKICLICIGPFGLRDGYLFLKALLPEERAPRLVCMADPAANAAIPDGLTPVEPKYLYHHAPDLVGIVLGLDEQGAVRKRFQNRGLKTYAMNRDHLFQLCDEFARRGDAARLRQFWKTREYQVQIETSSVCNARCVFCPNTSLKRRKNIMTDAVFEKILARIREADLRIGQFVLHLNGEPLTDPALFSRVRRLKAEFPGASVRFTTNFSLATEEEIEQILDCGLDEIICSLNSVDPQKYREIMGLEYERTVGNIERLLARKRERNSPLGVTLSIVAAEEDAEQVAAFRERWRGVQIRVMKLGKWIDQETPQDGSVRHRPGVCPGPYTKLHFLSNGDYAFCDFDAEGIVGCNVMDTSIRDAWNTPVFRKVRAWQLRHGRTNPECISCSF